MTKAEITKPKFNIFVDNLSKALSPQFIATSHESDAPKVALNKSYLY
ncbi:hypothetical protein PPL_05888 [Heterostelium album PN500]|uniref:Uncharacterized protein n=1 Tax=Heterostelium pallidum (strain ATCC 26659 / Pp 5 / PN500) TaxID=670386 RepID=D3BBL9_HETP5|nr:hypothetical protein PPL_05888 [Heterostelium album PN500]EFA81052.1 hypothetical protein PPL_05888 [Heterostelium album PN500]|eukprot:XP_020433170.1 hypothetical protein PPL_05888 [Heterostelium album PN500]